MLVYREGPSPLGAAGIGLVLTEVPGDIEAAYLAERDAGGLETVTVKGRPGYWSPSGRLPSSSARPTPDHVLLWEKRGLALRLEADLREQQAVRIAETVR